MVTETLSLGAFFGTGGRVLSFERHSRELSCLVGSEESMTGSLDDLLGLGVPRCFGVLMLARPTGFARASPLTFLIGLRVSFVEQGVSGSWLERRWRGTPWFEVRLYLFTGADDGLL